MNIIAFPFAGGDKFVYKFFKDHLKDSNISLTVLEYKGRGLQIKEIFSETIDEIIDDLMPDVLKVIEDNEEYIIYGHSMGALVGYLICQRLEELNVRSPVKLVVSGRKAPSIPTIEKISTLPDERFWNEIAKLGGVPEKILMEKSLRNHFGPIIRADFKVVENYIYQPNRQLKIPINVLYGKKELIHNTYFLDWKNETIKKTVFNEFEGNHFFIYDYPIDILNLICGIV